MLNGIPHHAGQAHDMESIATIYALVVLDCSADAVYCRLRENIVGDRNVRQDDFVQLVQEKLAIIRIVQGPSSSILIASEARSITVALTIGL